MTTQALSPEAASKTKTRSSQWPGWKRFLLRLGWFRQEQEVTDEWIEIDSIAGIFAGQHAPRLESEIERELQQNRDLLAHVERQFEEAASKTLQIEAALVESLKTEKNRRSAQLNKRIGELSFELGAVKLDKTYRRLDPGFLSKRKWSQRYRSAVPLFAVFAVNDPVCFLSVEGRGEYSRPHVHSNIPAALQSYFRLDRLQSWVHGTSDKVKFSARFEGAIPDLVRDKIHKASTEFEAVYVIAEAPEWQIEVTVPVPVADPLVVGLWHGHLWLIDTFDTTPSENYVVSEFTSRIRRE